MLVNLKWKRRAESTVAPLEPWRVKLRRGLATWEFNRRKPAKSAKPRKMNKDRRQHLISRAIDAMSDWRFSHFEFEGATRHALRASFCLEGWNWPDADVTAADIVEAALKEMGAQRPTWLQGQPEYQEKHSFGSYRYCRNPKCRRMLNEDQGNFCGKPCRDVVFAEDYRRLHRDEHNASQKLWRRTNREAYLAIRTREREKWEPRSCLTCGGEFRAATHSTQAYCSPACHHAVGQRENPNTPCAHCGELFRESRLSSTRKYCSPRCYRAAKKAESDKLRERQCPICMTIFRARDPSRPTIFCSKRCGAFGRRRYLPRTANLFDMPVGIRSIDYSVVNAMEAARAVIRSSRGMWLIDRLAA